VQPHGSYPKLFTTPNQERGYPAHYIELLAMGKPTYESIHEFENDLDFYKCALGIVRSIP